MVKSHRIYMFLSGSPTGLLTGLIRFSRNGILFQQIHQNAPFLHISRLSPVSCYMYDLSANMIIHFLHTRPSNPPTYYTDFYIDIFRLNQSNKSTLFTRSCFTRLLSSRTQHRLTHLCHFWRGATDNGGSNYWQPTRSPYRLPPFISLYTSCSSPHIITSA